jgi:hypothetical protein
MPREKKLQPPQHQKRQPGREYKMKPRPKAVDENQRGSGEREREELFWKGVYFFRV